MGARMEEWKSLLLFISSWLKRDGFWWKRNHWVKDREMPIEVKVDSGINDNPYCSSTCHKCIFVIINYRHQKFLVWIVAMRMLEQVTFFIFIFLKKKSKSSEKQWCKINCTLSIHVQTKLWWLWKSSIASRHAHIFFFVTLNKINLSPYYRPNLECLLLFYLSSYF